MPLTFITTPHWWRHANDHKEAIYNKWKDVHPGDQITPSWNDKITITVTGYGTDGTHLYLCYELPPGTNELQIKLDETTYPKTR